MQFKMAHTKKLNAYTETLIQVSQYSKENFEGKSLDKTYFLRLFQVQTHFRRHEERMSDLEDWNIQNISDGT